jgi:hypothetical protein
MKKLAIACLILISFALLLFNFFGFTTDKDNAYADNRRVAICHYPPDDPTNPRTLFLPETAVQAHLRHGDTLGECPSGCLLNATLCDDGNFCTSDTCLPNGDCEHVPVSCDDGNPCTLDSCEAATGCVNVANDGVSCNDGNACTYGDICVSTICTGQNVPGCCAVDSDCDDGDLCTVDICAYGTCKNSPKNCSEEDKCLVGFCEPSSGNCKTTPVTCNDGNACTNDICDSGIGCYSVPISDPPQEICDNGVDDDCDGLTDGADVIDCPNVTCPCWTDETIDEYARVLTNTVTCDEFSNRWITLGDRYDYTYNYLAQVSDQSGYAYCRLIDRDNGIDIIKQQLPGEINYEQAIKCAEILRNSRMWELNCTP